jgi:hypothetical protein
MADLAGGHGDRLIDSAVQVDAREIILTRAGEDPNASRGFPDASGSSERV